MMNPEMMKLAMEQMSKMTPDQMADMQRQMGSLSPAQMQAYQQQAANMSADDIQRARSQMNSMTPNQFRQAAGQAGNNIAAQERYQLDGAKTLKNAGNQLHSSKQYAAAIEKYKNAKQNLEEQLSPEAQELKKACMLNICSCQLNLGQFDACARECCEVLATDSNNRKALYRRGQAYQGLGRSREAVSDLQRALDMSPANEKDVVGAKLQEAQEAADKQAAAPLPSSQQQPPPAVSTSNSRPEPARHGQQAAPAQAQEYHVLEADSDGEGVEDIPEVEEIPQAQPQRAPPVTAPASNIAPGLDAQQMRMPPGMDPQQMQNMMQDPAAMRQAAEMMKTMDPAQLQSMAQMAGAPAGMQMSPEMIQMATNMMSSMSPEAMQSMMSMAAANSGAASSTQPAPSSGGNAASGAGGMQMDPKMMEQMQKHLSDPATAQMLTSFVQAMKPEDLSALLKQSGMDLSPQQAEQYLSFAKRISPRNMQLLLKASGYIMLLITLLRQPTNYMKQHPMIFWALVMLFIALMLRWFGWI